MRDKLCLILDLNGTLLQRSKKPFSHSSSLTTTSLLPSLRSNHEFKVNGSFVYLRPHLATFMNFLAEHSDKIMLGIWTSMTEENALEICSGIWNHVFPMDSKAPVKEGCWDAGILLSDGIVIAPNEEGKEGDPNPAASLADLTLRPLMARKAPLPISFLLTQNQCIKRKKCRKSDADPNFREFKPVMFKHLPMLWKLGSIPAEDLKAEVLAFYSRVTIKPQGRFHVHEAAVFQDHELEYPVSWTAPSVLLPGIHQENVLLVEDSKYKFAATPENGIILPEYDVKNKATDNELLSLITLLAKRLEIDQGS